MQMTEAGFQTITLTGPNQHRRVRGELRFENHKVVGGRGLGTKQNKKTNKKTNQEVGEELDVEGGMVVIVIGRLWAHTIRPCVPNGVFKRFFSGRICPNLANLLE